MLVRKLLRAVVLTVALLAMLMSAAAAQASQGSVNFVKRAGSDFDRYTGSGKPSDQQWIRAHFARMQVFAPYFDNKTSWYANGLQYADLYAIYKDSAWATQHPDWILHDAAGHKLYIPWGCSNGTCPQYAADIKNPAFRQAWIDAIKTQMTKGYRGVWIDDVNLTFQVGDGTGAHVAPIDRSTGQPMTETAWRSAVADFVAQVRAALPHAEILHNSIWFAGGDKRDADPSVQREIDSADIINIERGTNDGGLTGGNGSWSLNALLGFIDRVHARGKSVVLDAYDGSEAGREYNLANYFLISTGRDSIGESHAAPDNWWHGWDLDLGAASGDRRQWDGVLRRDFACGLVLVNAPDSPQRTLTLPGPMLTVDGRTVSTVTLAATRGAVLRYPAGAAAIPAPSPATAQPAPTVPPRPVSPVKRVTVAPRSYRAKVVRHGRALSVRGRARAAAGGKVRVELQHRVRGHWRRVSRRLAAVGADGHFSAAFRRVRVHGPFRARAATVATAAAAACTSA